MAKKPGPARAAARCAKAGLKPLRFFADEVEVEFCKCAPNFRAVRGRGVRLYVNSTAKE
jgi:hypothetical protein